jgi:hypothetical protein
MALSAQGPGAIPDLPVAYAGSLVALTGSVARVVVPAYSGDRIHLARFVAPAGVPVGGEPCVVLFTDAEPVALFFGAGP